MTKEELEKEADEYLKNLDECKTKDMMRNAYLASAKPREKQIAELKQQLGNLYEIIKRPYQFTAPTKIQMIIEAEQFLKEE